MPLFNIKQGDTRPAIEAVIPANLTGASVEFLMADLEGEVVIEEVVTPTDAVAGEVSYDFDGSDVLIAGIFRAWFRVTFSGGKIETYPNSEKPDDTPLFIQIPSQYG